MDVLDINDTRELLLVARENFAGPRVSEEEFDYLLRLTGGLWLHNGDPKAPHAELTSGRCSDGFVNTMMLLKYPNICTILAEDAADAYLRSGGPDPDWVIGSSYAAITFSFALAAALDAKHGFTEKVKLEDGTELQVWKREEIEPGEVVLQGEELVSTNTTLGRVREGVIEGNPHEVTFVHRSVVLVHRSAEYTFEGDGIVYLRHYDINTWAGPEACPLCAGGSKRLRPKQNWAELTLAA